MLDDCLTIDDYEGLPAVLARNHELIDGELVEESGKTLQHNLLRDLLGVLLAPYVRQHEFGIFISGQAYDFDGNAYGPDVSFISASKRPLLDMKLRVQRLVPDVAIEIASPTDTFDKLAKKALRYRACGMQEVWILAPQARQAFLFSEHRRTILDENDEFRPESIPGFAIRIGDFLDRY
jgi:Uma2 family endonuclease